MRVNNETGAVYDVEGVSKAVKARHPRALAHSDCVQAFLKEKISPTSLGVDMISVSSHKVHAPKGSGALIVKKGLTLPPHTFGGGQEKGVRSGTENTLGIALFGEAVRILSRDTEKDERVGRIYDKLVSLLSCVPRVTLNLPETPSHSILNFSVNGIRSETLLHALSARGVFVSSGSACSSKSGPSPVLHAFGLDKARADSALRLSLSVLNTEEEAKEFAIILQEEIKRLAR
jgi:cysteine desulfurase